MSHEHRPGSAACRELFARLSEYLDGELDEGSCSEMDGHFEGCPPCRRFLESLRRTVDLIGKLPAAELPERLRHQVLDACGRLRRDQP